MFCVPKTLGEVDSSSAMTGCGHLERDESPGWLDTHLGDGTAEAVATGDEDVEDAEVRVEQMLNR